MHSSTDNSVAVVYSCPNLHRMMKVSPTRFSLMITVALVVLIFRDQLVQFGITILFGDTTGDSGLNPLQYLVIISVPATGAPSIHRSM